MIPSEHPSSALSRRALSAHLVGDHRALAHFQHLFFTYWFDLRDGSKLVEWAVELLQRNEQGDDLDIVLLASLGEEDSPRDLIENIFQKYSGWSLNDEDLVAGKFIVLLRERYLAGSESIDSLDHQFRRIFYFSSLPDWLAGLMRICEYANVIAPGYQVPFEREFEYIAGLWFAANSFEEFKGPWNREVSERTTRYDPKWHPRQEG